MKLVIHYEENLFSITIYKALITSVLLLNEFFLCVWKTLVSDDASVSVLSKKWKESNLYQSLYLFQFSSRAEGCYRTDRSTRRSSFQRARGLRRHDHEPARVPISNDGQIFKLIILKTILTNL
jgi:hypothetical protein